MKFQEFKKIINKPYFSVSDISFVRTDTFLQQLDLWKNKGYLGRFKRGLYFFVDDEPHISSQEVAFLLYQPSYISMETMLVYYGLIPEMVYSQTCITTKTTRKFFNNFGNFTYRHIKPELFFGYIPVETKFGKYLIAEPEKALIDYFYFNLGKIENKDDISELRINCEELKKIIDRKKLDRYLEEFDIKKLKEKINLLFELC